MLHDTILLNFYNAVILQRCSEYLLAEIPNNVETARHSPAKHTSQQQEIFTPVSKTFTLLVIRSQF